MINLLLSRETVTLDKIRSTCNVPTRTVYRYLNWISEANIPVYYDRDSQAYRLSRSRRLSLDDISLHESALLMICLKLMAAHVNKEYGDDIERLVTKLLVRQPASLDGDFVRALGSRSNGERNPDYSELVATSLVTAAVAAGRSVQIHTQGENGEVQVEEIAEPRLCFAEGWSIDQVPASKRRPKRLASVNKVTLL